MGIFKELALNESNITPNAIEYIKRELFKKKKLLTACNAFVKKFRGDAALVGTVDYSGKELADAVLFDIASDTINVAKRYKEGMGHMAVQSSADRFNIDIEELKSKIKDIIKDENVNGILTEYKYK